MAEYVTKVIKIKIKTKEIFPVLVVFPIKKRIFA